MNVWFLEEGERLARELVGLALTNDGAVDIEILRQITKRLQSQQENHPSPDIHAEMAIRVALHALIGVVGNRDELNKSAFDIGLALERFRKSTAHAGPMNLHLIRAKALGGDRWRTMRLRDLWDAVERDPVKRADPALLEAFKKARKRAGYRPRVSKGTE